MVEVGGIAAERLRQLIERIERLEDEKTALAADVREIYAEAKAVGLTQKLRVRSLDCVKWTLLTNRRWKP